MKSEKSDIFSGESPRPFVYTLPDGTTKYTPLLQKGQSVKMESGYMALQPGEEVGSHNTGTHEELIVVLEGQGFVEAGRVGRRIISKGHIAYNPPGTTHNVVNTGKEPLRYIFIISEAY